MPIHASQAAKPYSEDYIRSKRPASTWHTKKLVITKKLLMSTCEEEIEEVVG